MKKEESSAVTAAPSLNTALEGYAEFLQAVKERVQSAQVRAALAVNSELVLLYWGIGRDILTRQREQGWGAKIIDRLSSDLIRDFPQMKGFSTRNLKYMRAFAEAWHEEPFVQEVLAQITWYHNIALLEKISDSQERVWYAEQTSQNGWSRNVLVHQIGAIYTGGREKRLLISSALSPPRNPTLPANSLKTPTTSTF